MSKQKKVSDPMVGGKRLSEWRSRLADKNASVRLNAAVEIDRIGKRAHLATPALIEALEDDDARVRDYAARALSNYGVKAGAAVPALIQALKDASPEVRSMAGAALCAIGPVAEPAVPALVKALADKDARHNAGRALGAIGPAAAVAVPALARMLALAKKDQVAASWWASSLGKLGAAAVSPLMEIVLNSSGDARAFAAAALGEIGPDAESAVPALIAAIQGEGRSLLCYAARSLGKIGADSKVVVPALVKLLKAEDDDVRRAAMESLGRFGPEAKSAVPELVSMLVEKSWFRLFAAEALGNIGPNANKAVPELNKLLNDKERKIREAAELAISRITEKPVSEALQRRMAPAPDATTIDFIRTKEVVARMLVEGVSSFSKEHPGVEVSCVGLFGQGFGCCAALCFETPEHSAQHVKEWASKGQVGKDKLGQFTDNIYEFAYCEYVSEDFDWWPNLYDVGPDFKIKMPNGKVVRRSTDKNGNQAIDKPLFELLQEVLREAGPFKALRLAKPFRLGVEIANSGFVKFWVPKN